MASRGSHEPQDVLARRCRRLLVAYPRDYRAVRGEELVATMLEATGAGRRLPRLADAADLVANGLWRRVAAGGRAGLDGGLATVGPVGLAVAAGISLFAWWRVEPAGLATVGPIGYGAWLLAAAGWLLPRPAPRRAMVAAAIGMTVLLPVLAVALSVDRPPLWVLMALCAFGGLCLAGTAPAVGRRDRLPFDERFAVPAGAVAIAVSSSAVMQAWPAPDPSFGYYYQPTIARVGLVVGLAVVGLAGFAVIRLLRGGNAQPWLWATVLLALPAGWFGPFDPGGLSLAADQAVPRFGRLAQVLLGTSIAIIAMAWLSRRRRPGVPAVRPLGLDALRDLGWGMLGCTAGLTAFIGAAWASLVGFAEPSTSVPLPRHVAITLSALAVAGICGITAAPPRRLVAPPTAPATRVLAWRRALPVRWFAVGSVLAAGSSWLVASYDNNWTVGGWTDFGHTSGLVMTLAFVPFTWAVIVAANALGAARKVARQRTRGLAATGVVAVAVGWIGYVALPYVLLWGPVLVILVVAVGVLVLSAKRGPSPSGLPG